MVPRVSGVARIFFVAAFLVLIAQGPTLSGSAGQAAQAGATIVNGGVCTTCGITNTNKAVDKTVEVSKDGKTTVKEDEDSPCRSGNEGTKEWKDNGCDSKKGTTTAKGSGGAEDVSLQCEDGEKCGPVSQGSGGPSNPGAVEQYANDSRRPAISQTPITPPSAEGQRIMDSAFPGASEGNTPLSHPITTPAQIPTSRTDPPSPIPGTTLDYNSPPSVGLNRDLSSYAALTPPSQSSSLPATPAYLPITGGATLASYDQLSANTFLANPTWDWNVPLGGLRGSMSVQDVFGNDAGTMTIGSQDQAELRIAVPTTGGVFTGAELEKLGFRGVAPEQTYGFVSIAGDTAFQDSQGNSVKASEIAALTGTKLSADEFMKHINPDAEMTMRYTDMDGTERNRTAKVSTIMSEFGEGGVSENADAQVVSRITPNNTTILTNVAAMTNEELTSHARQELAHDGAVTVVRQGDVAQAYAMQNPFAQDQVYQVHDRTTPIDKGAIVARAMEQSGIPSEIAADAGVFVNVASEERSKNQNTLEKAADMFGAGRVVQYAWQGPKPDIQTIQVEFAESGGAQNADVPPLSDMSIRDIPEIGSSYEPVRVADTEESSPRKAEIDGQVITTSEDSWSAPGALSRSGSDNGGGVTPLAIAETQQDSRNWLQKLIGYAPPARSEPFLQQSDQGGSQSYTLGNVLSELFGISSAQARPSNNPPASVPAIAPAGPVRVSSAGNRIPSYTPQQAEQLAGQSFNTTASHFSDPQGSKGPLNQTGIFFSSPDLPEGTPLRVEVTNNKGRTTVLEGTVQDFGPDTGKLPDRLVDLSQGACRAADACAQGLSKAKVTVLPKASNVSVQGRIVQNPQPVDVARIANAFVNQVAAQIPQKPETAPVRTAIAALQKALAPGQKPEQQKVAQTPPRVNLQDAKKTWLSLEGVPSDAEIAAYDRFDFDPVGHRSSGGMEAARKILAAGKELAVYHEGGGGSQPEWGERVRSPQEVLNDLTRDIPNIIKETGAKKLTMHVDNVERFGEDGLRQMIDTVVDVCRRNGAECKVAMKNSMAEVKSLLTSTPAYAEKISYHWIENIVRQPQQMTDAKAIAERGVPVSIIGFGSLLPSANLALESAMSAEEMQKLLVDNPWLSGGQWSPREISLAPTQRFFGGGGATAGTAAQNAMDRFASAQPPITFGTCDEAGKCTVLDPKAAAQVPAEKLQVFEVLGEAKPVSITQSAEYAGSFVQDGIRYAPKGGAQAFMAQKKQEAQASLENTARAAQLGSLLKTQTRVEGSGSSRAVYAQNQDGTRGQQVGRISTVTGDQAKIKSVAAAAGITLSEKNGRLVDSQGRTVALRTVPNPDGRSSVFSSLARGGGAPQIPGSTFKTEYWQPLKDAPRPGVVAIVSHQSYGPHGTGRGTAQGQAGGGKGAEWWVLADGTRIHSTGERVTGHIGENNPPGAPRLLQLMGSGGGFLGNPRAVGIEFEGSGKLTPEQIASGKELIAFLQERYNLNSGSILKHGKDRGVEGAEMEAAARAMGYVPGTGLPYLQLFAGEGQNAVPLGQAVPSAQIRNVQTSTVYESTDAQGQPDGKVSYTLNPLPNVGIADVQLTKDAEGNLALEYGYTPPATPDTKGAGGNLASASNAPFGRSGPFGQQGYGAMQPWDAMRPAGAAPQPSSSGSMQPGGGSAGGGGQRPQTTAQPAPIAQPSPVGQAGSGTGSTGTGGTGTGGIGTGAVNPSVTGGQVATGASGERFSCAPAAVVNNSTTTPLVLTWVCPAGTRSVGYGFSTLGTNTGTTTLIVATTSPTVRYELECLGAQTPRRLSCTARVIHPKVTLVARPADVRAGENTELRWNATEVSSCELFAPNGTRIMRGGATGEATTLPLSETTTFTATCATAGGDTVSTRATVSVTR